MNNFTDLRQNTNLREVTDENRVAADIILNADFMFRPTRADFLL